MSRLAATIEQGVGDIPFLANLKQSIIDLFGLSSIIGYWPDLSGTTLTDVINGHNGTITNSISGATGVYHETPASFVGTGYGNLYSAGGAAAFNGAKGTWLTWAKINGLADWSDGAFHVLGRILVDGSNSITIAKHSTNGELYSTYLAGGVNRTPSVMNCSQLDWFNFGVRWDNTTDKAETIINGAPTLDIYQTLGTWAGIPVSTGMSFGSNLYNSASVAWRGSIAHMLLLNRAITDLEAMRFVDLFGRGFKKVGILGDSISASNISGWQSLFRANYNNGNMRLNNHAVGGQGIETYMAIEAAAAANDDNDLIHIMLGTNDVDHASITATYQTGIATLKASNPRARIIGWGIFNKVDETYRATNNSRIQTACASEGITYVNTDGMITPATDLSDGVHPNAAGAAKICAQVMARS